MQTQGRPGVLTRVSCVAKSSGLHFHVNLNSETPIYIDRNWMDCWEHHTIQKTVSPRQCPGYQDGLLTACALPWVKSVGSRSLNNQQEGPLGQASAGPCFLKKMWHLGVNSLMSIVARLYLLVQISWGASAWSCWILNPPSMMLWD